MARINTYELDTKVTKNDKVIGTDSNGLVTKNFKLKDIASFFSNTNAISIANQFNFRFVISNRGIQTLSFNSLAGNNTEFGDVSEFVLSKIDNNNNNIEEYLKTFSNKKVVIVKLDDFSNFGLFDVSTITQHSSLPDYLTVSLVNRTNEGSFIADAYYGIAIYSEGDKHYTHNQNNASATWNVTHNLNKHPSVSVVLSTGQQGIADVQYINKNELTITLLSAQSGKAYLN